MRVSRRRRTHQFFALATSLLFLVFVEELSAQHRTEAEHDSDHALHKNHAAFFLGASTITDAEEGEDATSFTVGADYERRLSHLWGVGGLIDIVAPFGDIERDVLIAPAVFVHPAGGLRLVAAPGIELKRVTAGAEPGGGTEAAGESTETETEFALRLGASYQFEVGSRFTVGPEFDVDLLERETVLVYGVAFGVGF